MFQYTWVKKLLLISVLALSLLLTGCPGGGEQKPITPPVKVGISLADMERDGNKIIKKVMDKRRRQDKVSLIWQDAQNDPDKQQQQIDQLLKQEVKVVVLQLVDPAMGPDIVQKLTKQGVKVLALETLPANTPLDGYIASDHLRIGELQARYVLQQAAAAGKPFRVLVLQGDPSDLAARDITAANEEALKGSPQVAELRVKNHLQAEPRLARTTVEEMLAGGGAPDAILANDSRLATAAVEVLKARNLSEQVVTVGVGADRKSSEGIAAGDHEAEVDNSPELLAQYLMDAAVDLAQKDHWQYDTQVQNGPYDVPAKITPVRLITKDELYLLTDRWGNLEDKTKQEEQQTGQQGGQESGGSSSGGSEQGSGQGSGSGGEQGSEQQQKPKTTLRIKTQDGKTMEVEIDGEVKTIETQEGGKQQEGQQGGQGGQ